VDAVLVLLLVESGDREKGTAFEGRGKAQSGS
jgi:hypothetical protein